MTNNYELKIKIIFAMLDYLDLIDTDSSVKIIENIISINDISQLKDYMLDVLIASDAHKNIFTKIMKILETGT